MRCSCSTAFIYIAHVYIMINHLLIRKPYISSLYTTGPKLYVKPASKSNRHIITNAIAHCVLAGAVNQDNKDKVLQVSCNPL